ncbi:hypothetical protein CWE09_01670 [Aliidiomarina minuta]|uniref:Glycosyltransferase n=1 Tax=Aliidiomarina minuta TaxID=880057 RepID=A0A432W614_9GAMM|nr:TIGR04282 family arsenosugar biosynthesis glycosyltransferase [Aliidiomarina minuta]RUO25471.1 hypothetical protein CWE09_01670 [Aliidiomarina minuta]
MNTAIAIFVKTPSLSPVKTRLAASIGKEKAQQFFIHSLQAVEETVAASDADLYWAVAEKEGLQDPLWQQHQRLHTGEGDLGQRQHHIYQSLRQQYAKVILIGADAPQLSQELLQQAIQALDHSELVLGPATDGGYYLFAGTVDLDAAVWTDIPWSTEQTRESLQRKLPFQAALLPTLSDVDTLGDLTLVLEELPLTPGPMQRQVFNWIRVNR